MEGVSNSSHRTATPGTIPTSPSALPRRQSKFTSIPEAMILSSILRNRYIVYRIQVFAQAQPVSLFTESMPFH